MATAKNKNEFETAWVSQVNTLSSLHWNFEPNDPNVEKLNEAQRLLKEVIFAASENSFPDD